MAARNGKYLRDLPKDRASDTQKNKGHCELPSGAAFPCPSRIADVIQVRLACYDSDLRLVWINEYSASLLGRFIQELLGQTCCRIWQNCDQPIQRCHMIRAKETESPQTAEITTPDGRVWLLQAFPEFDGQGRLKYINEYGRDITEEKRVRQLEKDIQAITRHDLKTPAINAVYVSRLLGEADNLSPSQRELVEALSRAGQEMLETINNTLVLYRIELGDYEPSLETVDCVKVMREALEILSNHPRASEVKVELEMSCEMDECNVPGDFQLLRTAFLNFLRNAVEASPRGDNVMVEATSGPPVIVSIFNKGAVPADIRGRFFSKFATSGKPKGTGLGAWGARKMIEVLGGSVSMRTSDQDKGWTLITIELPAFVGPEPSNRSLKKRPVMR